MNKYKISGLILAAGKSGRIGKAKAFLKINNKSFISEIINKLYLVCEKIIVVFGFESEKMIDSLLKDNSTIDLLNKLKIVVNKNFESGMFGSIQCGLKELKDYDFVLIHQVDQPSLPQKFYYEFYKQIEKEADWIQPEFNGRLGHPIIIGQKLVNEILSEDSYSNLRLISKKKNFTKKLWKCNYFQILQDIDTPEDYEKLLKD